jgi:ribonuclease P protein component
LTHRHTLSKRERLKSYKRIRILFAQGQKFKVFPLVVYFLLRVEDIEGRVREVEGGLGRLREVEEVEGIEELSLPTIVGKPAEGRGGLERLREVEGVEGLSLPAEGREVEGILQMGVSVGKRHFKRAVDRNLLKRRIREAYRKQKHELKEFLMASGISMDIFFVYSNARISDYAEIESAMTQGLTILIDKLKTQTSKKN